jgi:hypothetical protein
MNESVDIVSYSRCGDHTAILNVNSEVRVTPVNTDKKGSMTVSDGLRFTVARRWCLQTCENRSIPLTEGSMLSSRPTGESAEEGAEEGADGDEEL